jgi:hypothetical protein
LAKARCAGRCNPASPDPPRSNGEKARLRKGARLRRFGSRQPLEAADVAQAVGVEFTAVVVGEVAAGPVGANAVAAVEEVVGAGAVVDAFAVFGGREARDLSLDLGRAVADAAEQLEVRGDRQNADGVDRSVILMLQVARDAGDGDVVVLDAERDFAFGADVGLNLAVIRPVMAPRVASSPSSWV